MRKIHIHNLKSGLFVLKSSVLFSVLPIINVLLKIYSGMSIIVTKFKEYIKLFTAVKDCVL